jgi:mannose-1-phosphate guanylyltransferase
LTSAESFAKQLPAVFIQRHFSLQLSHEAELLGTAGGVQFASPRLSAPLIVWNGDIWLEPALRTLHEQVAGSRAAICLLAAPAENGAPGTLGLDQQGRVVRLRGERFGDEHSAADYLGLIAMSEAAVAWLPKRGCLIGDLCLPHLRAGGVITTLEHSGRWFDIGSLEGYRDANFHWLQGHAGNFVAPDAQVPVGTRISSSIVGGGAVLTGQGTVKGSIIWPHARSVLPCCDVVVTASGRQIPLPRRGEGEQ